MLAAALFLSLSGCGSFLEADYLLAEDYVDDLPVIEGTSVLIGNYQSLKKCDYRSGGGTSGNRNADLLRL